MAGIGEYAAQRRAEGVYWHDIADELITQFPETAQLTHTQRYDTARNKFRTIQKQRARSNQEEKKRIMREGSAVNLLPEVYDHEHPGMTHIRIGIVSDTHFGSKYAQYSALQEFYAQCKQLGITDIYHAGDIDDGSETMHIGVMYEHHCIGATEHIRNIVEHYPQVDGIETHFITGNHDNSHMKNAGILLGEEIALRRPDMHYLGRDIAIVKLAPGCTMELRHPGDGTSYAISYKPQKIVEAYAGGKKPNILIVGHYHKAMWFMQRNIHVLMAGSFCGTTPFMRSKNIASVVGGWVLDIDVDDAGTIKALTPTFYPFYDEVENDWRILDA